MIYPSPNGLGVVVVVSCPVVVVGVGLAVTILNTCPVLPVGLTLSEVSR